MHEESNSKPETEKRYNKQDHGYLLFIMTQKINLRLDPEIV